jgi:indolepyruvate ferredoxin oxidoreductase alpha subunit
MKTEILLGDEAVALAALHSGIGGSFAYPGTPATELQEYIFRVSKKYPDVYVEWSTNEKTAYEAALGMSYIGKRSIVSMKHVGLNVAADAFINSAVTGVNGGLVLMVADDPGMHSSQNEQDSRFYGDFAKIPFFEPSNQQEAYDMTIEAFRLSEELELPVMIRLVMRLSHSRSNVQTSEPVKYDQKPESSNAEKWTLLPSNARVQNKNLLNLQPKLLEYSNNSQYQLLNSPANGQKRGVITSGIGYNYFMENKDYAHLPHLKISVYPLPEKMLIDFTEGLSEVLIFEDGYPFIESRLQSILKNPELKVKGKLSGDLPADGELNPDLVRKALGGEVKKSLLNPPEAAVLSRPPRLCDGCSHREVYNILDKLRDEFKGVKVFSDIGCYTLGALRTPPSIDSTVCMGASIGMAKGAANGGLKYSIAVIGDSTFFHSGIPTLVKAAGDNTPFTLIILDNSTTGMTGGQSIPIPGNKIEAFIAGLGVPKEHIRILDPRKIKSEENIKAMREELEFRGFSVIIARRECIQYMKTTKK